MTEITFTNTMQTFPQELLSEIFWHCVQVYHRYDSPTSVVPVGYVTRSALCAPLLLGRVCSRWRTTSISTPKIWTSIVIGVYERNIPSNYSLEKDMEATTVWVNRSGTRPLSFHIHLFGRPIDESGVTILGVLGLVVSQSWRWKTLRTSILTKFMKTLLAPLREGNAPKLENFCCTQRGDSSGFGRHPFTLSSVPRLERLYMIDVPIDMVFGDQMHHHHLIDIRLAEFGNLSLEDLFRCLTQCPSLERLYLTMCKFTAIALENILPANIELPHLHTLNLGMFATADPCLLFDRIILPSLTTLKFSLIRSSKSEWPHLLSMLKRSRPPLVSLCLYGIPMTERTLVECFSYMPKLTVLAYNRIDCSDITLAALSRQCRG
ncbi:hypothetical protein BD410DRAFT_481266 [Rickenella mellea]|uniref:F-box domain-containing protein n=1 Tax=Rickenella mellea TaxID=50990 RepID=A0A4Y7QIT5_9AGAM|nr:hypothetical protein BD410DRAFT_481266 [Rickenella mellea]